MGESPEKLTKFIHPFSTTTCALILVFWFAERISASLPMFILEWFLFPVCVAGCFCLFTAYALIRCWKIGGIAFYPLLMFVVAILMWSQCAFIHMKANYLLHWVQRNVIIARIQESPALIEQYSKELPLELKSASAMNGIYVERNTTEELEIHFNVSKGFYPPLWVIVYSSDGEFSRSGEIIKNHLRMGKNWYAVEWRPMTDADRYYSKDAD